MFNGIKKIRTNLKDPKKKAITQLVLYLIFFGIVFLVISNAEKKDQNYVNNEVSIFNYNYTINIDENNNVLDISGNYSRDLEVFNYNGNTYTIENDKIYLNNEEVINPIKYNIKDYYYNSIEELINSYEYIEQTTYKDKSTKTIYNIKVEDYFKDTNYECLDNCLNDVVVTVYKNDYIYNVVIDLTSVNNYKYIIDIKYEKTSD